MKKRYGIACLALVLCWVTTSEAREIGGVSVPETLSAGGEKLVLNGAGQRSKFLIDAYVAGLYLKKKSADPVAIINADETMAIRLHITSRLITADMMADQTREGFEESTNGNTAPIKKEIEDFIRVFKGGVKKDVVYDIIYRPGIGIEVYRNGKQKLVTKGLALKKALFGIWLAPHRRELKDLRLGMLGKK